MIEVDFIGALYKPNVEGEPVALPGWHVNVTNEGLATRTDLESYVVTPTVLRRVWAGDNPTDPVVTVALRFADEAASLAILNA